MGIQGLETRGRGFLDLVAMKPKLILQVAEDAGPPLDQCLALWILFEVTIHQSQGLAASRWFLGAPELFHCLGEQIPFVIVFWRWSNNARWASAAGE
jgi:hypothetical protein